MSETQHAASLRDTDADDGRSWWLLPHLHDGLGDRYLSFGESGAMVERLHVRDALAARPDFADAVRQRIRDLAAVRSPWVASMEIVEPGTPGSLDLMSEHCTMRLAEVQTDDAPTALAVLEQLLCAAAVLHAVRPDVSHGAIDATRVGLAAEGHIRLLEPAFGSAIAALAADGESVWGAAAPIRRVGHSADVVLCARVGLALLAGEAFTPESSRDFAAFDDRVIARCTPDVAAWFRRAMHLDAEPWDDAAKALAALQPLLAGTADSRAALVAVLARDAARDGSPAPGLAVSVVEPQEPADAAFEAPQADRLEDARPDEPVTDREAQAVLAAAIADADPPAPTPPPTPRPRVSRPAPPATTAAAPARVERPESAAPAAATPRSRRGMLLTACVVLLAIVAAGQAVYIVRNYASTTISVSPPPAPAVAAPADAPRAAGVPPVTLASAVSIPAAEPELPSARLPETRPATPAGPVGGWLAVPSPIELDIFRGGELVGTSRSARVMLPEGRHTLDLVNQEVGFRQTIVVTVAPGRESAAPVKIPNGVVHANALPWAEVFIDGNRAGETPLGNLQVPLGRHEVVFRHPSLGERRQTVLVTAGEPARISVDLRR